MDKQMALAEMNDVFGAARTNKKEYMKRLMILSAALLLCGYAA